MRNPKNEFYEEVRFFYFTGKYTQKEISKKTGVPERTIRNWVKDGHWIRLRENTNNAPAVMLENFINQLIELQNTIASRTPGDRWPRDWEADIQRTLLNSIVNMKKYPADMIASFGTGLAPISDVIFAGDPPSETEKNQMPFQEPLRVRYDAYENEGIQVCYKISKDVLENAETIENESLNTETERPEGGHLEATNGQTHNTTPHDYTDETEINTPRLETHNIPSEETFNTQVLKETGQLQSHN